MATFAGGKVYLNTLQDWIQKPQHPASLVQYKLCL